MDLDAHIEVRLFLFNLYNFCLIYGIQTPDLKVNKKRVAQTPKKEVLQPLIDWLFSWYED